MGDAAALQRAIGDEPVYEEFAFTNAPAPFNGVQAVLNARYVFNNMEKLLFALGTMPVILADHKYAEAQDDITYTTWHRRRGMSEHMLRTFFAPMALALNFTPVDKISAEAMLRVFAYFASSKNASRAGFFDGPPSERFVDPLVAHVRGRGQDVELDAGVSELIFEGGRCAGAPDDRRPRVPRARHDPRDAGPQRREDPARRDVARSARPRRRQADVESDHQRPSLVRQKGFSLLDLIFAPGTILPVHADLGQASPGYEWEGRSFIEVCVAPADDLIARDDEYVIDAVMRDLESIYPLATRHALVKAKLVRVPKSVYRASPGAEKLRPGSRTPVPNLFLAGCYTNHRFPASIEGAVRSARAAVDLAIEQIGVRA